VLFVLYHNFHCFAKLLLFVRQEKGGKHRRPVILFFTKQLIRLVGRPIHSFHDTPPPAVMARIPTALQLADVRGMYPGYPRKLKL
jgi:hypothetical protein